MYCVCVDLLTLKKKPFFAHVQIWQICLFGTCIFPWLLQPHLRQNDIGG